MSPYLVVLTTTSDRALAEKIAAALIERHLAGCVQITGPVQSVYRWEGQLEHADEWLCLIKTMHERYAQVEAAIRELHTYQVPEIVALPITAGSAPYLDWLRGECSG
jgi:periplasmic divalent cation tolerance protein